VLDLGIVIVNYNTRDDLARCLASIAASDGRSAYEVVVVDNGSQDGSAQMVRERYPWARLIVSERNGGYAYANNLGLRLLGYGVQGLATGGDPHETPVGAGPRYALLLNPDTVLPPDALDTMVAYLDAHQQVGVAGPRLVRRDGSLDRACRRSFPTPSVSFYHLAGLSKLFPHSPRFGRYNMTYVDEHVETEVDAVVGAFMLMRSEALEQAGLLDESFFMYGEDLDLCYRIKQRGWQIRYVPQVTVLHVKGASSRKNSLQATMAFYDAMKIFHDKHYRAETCFVVNWAVDLGVALLRAKALLINRLRPPARRRVASA
jgi:N-acetylglucosaminyl-diphospho-decaprenol L-rhamnosyltransferase